MPSIVKLMMKSRKRRIPKGVHKLLKHAAEISDEEALLSAQRLTQLQRDRAQRYGMGAALGASTYPLVGFAGDAAEGVARGLLAPGPKLPAVGKLVASAAAKNLASPDLAKSVAKGALTGSGVQALREHVSSLPDARIVDEYIRANRGA